MNERYLNTFDAAISFVQEMRLIEEVQTGKTVSTVMLPSMIYNENIAERELLIKRNRIFSNSNSKDKHKNKDSQDKSAASTELLFASQADTKMAKPPKAPSFLKERSNSKGKSLRNGNSVERKMKSQ